MASALAPSNQSQHLNNLNQHESTVGQGRAALVRYRSFQHSSRPSTSGPIQQRSFGNISLAPSLHPPSSYQHENGRQTKGRQPRKSFSGLDHAKAVAVAKFRRASDSIKDRIQAISGKLPGPAGATGPTGQLSNKSRAPSRTATSSRQDFSSQQQLSRWPPHTDNLPLRENGSKDAAVLSHQKSLAILRDRPSAQRLPNQSQASPSLASLYSQNGGAAARAFAARENLRLNSGATPRTLVRRDSNICLSDVARDAESGIDVAAASLRNGEASDRRVELDVQEKDLLASMPAELMLQIFSNLDAPSLLTAARVSKLWREAAFDTEVWRGIFLSEYGPKKQTKSLPQPVGGMGIGKVGKVPHDWKKMYKARRDLGKNWKQGKATAIYLSGHTDSVYCVQFDEDKIITGSRDQTIRVWDMHTFQCRKVIGSHHVINADRRDLGAFTEPSPTLAGGLRVHRLPLQAIDPSIYHVPKYHHTASILCLQYDDEIMVTGSSDNSLIKWDIHTFEPLQRLRRHSAGVLDIAFDERKIVSCSKDTTVCIWDRETGILLQQICGHRGPVNAVQLRGDLVVSASGEGAARLWNLNMNPSNGSLSSNTCQGGGRIVDTKRVKEFWSQDRGLACIEFSDDAQFVLAGGNDQSIYKFDTQSGNRVAELTGHTNLVRSLYLDGSNGRIISGSYDMSLRVWDYTTGKSMAHFPQLTTSWMLSAKSDYRRILSTSQDGRTLILDFGWNVENVDLLEG